MKYPVRPCPIPSCSSTGGAPHGVCTKHLPDFPAAVPEQLRFAVLGLHVATPAEASLFLGLPFVVVDRELRTLAKIKGDPVAKAAQRVLDRAHEHRLPTAWSDDDACCQTCGTLVRKPSATTPVEYFVGGPEAWTWTTSAPVCRPLADGTLHVFTWTVREHPTRAGNEWIATCGHCPTVAGTTDDPHAGAPPAVTYRAAVGKPWLPACPPCPPSTGT